MSIEQSRTTRNLVRCLGSLAVVTVTLLGTAAPCSAQPDWDPVVGAALRQAFAQHEFSDGRHFVLGILGSQQHVTPLPKEESSKVISTSTLHDRLKDFLSAAADELASKSPNDADRLRMAPLLLVFRVSATGDHRDC